ncbi:GTPase ObgE [Candidatus Campbellbacteria bacterium]|nr:MAG: GTPase ObgE [Candidatus Campbellbacteria bacterium]
MAFVDELTIHAKAGDGGNGIVSWLRLKYMPKGGPAGGDGGKGGDVYFRATRNLSKLADYRAKPYFKAQRGHDGMRRSKEGYNGEDLYIELPIGSTITRLSDGSVFSMLKEGEEIKVLTGGKGGLGNERFKSSRNTTPEIQTDGKEGEEDDFKIELELLVDLGMVGLPSAGKSSLVNQLTGSKAKVAEYHFTTLEPSLGVFHKYILADIPGLIEGASEGKGLGYKFLKHIKRTKAIAHLVSFENENMFEAYEKIQNELKAYSEELVEKPEIILLTKTDLVDSETVQKTKTEFEKKYKKPVFCISIINDQEMKEFSSFLSTFLNQQNQ